LSQLSLEEADVVRFHRDIRLDPAASHVLDRVTGEEFELNRQGVFVAELIQEGVPLSLLSRFLADEFNIDYAEALADVSSLVESFDSRGLIQIDRHMRSRWRPASLQARWFLLLQGQLLHRPLSRLDPKYSAIVHGGLRSTGAFILVSFSLAAVFYFAGYLAYGAPTAKTVYALASPTLFVVGFALCLIAHEAGHLYAINLCKASPYFLAVRSWSLALHYGGSSAADDRRIGAAGPVFGMIASALVSSLILMCGQLAADSADFAYFTLAATFLPHVWSIMPWTSDGGKIWRSPADADDSKVGASVAN
jgi:hypothetical protein